MTPETEITLILAVLKLGVYAVISFVVWVLLRVVTSIIADWRKL